MLEIKSVEWKNFLSYGDYKTVIDIENLGQCLVIGEVIDDEKRNIRKSNGAGKSTIPNVIQWVLFGRTMHSRSPGNNIINYFSGKDCIAKVSFVNGDSITRTRSQSGKSELIYIKDGNENRIISDTLSTAANQQKELNKIFNLDWDIFSGSVFFNQYGKPWMEMTDQARKKTIERLLHVDRLTYYAQASKLKVDSLDLQTSQLKYKRQTEADEIERLKSDLVYHESSVADFNNNKKHRIERIKEKIKESQINLKSIYTPSIQSLEERWDLINKVEIKINKLTNDLFILKSELATLQGNKKSLEEQYYKWNSKSGKVCSTCEQTVLTEHIQNKVEPIENELTIINSKILELKSKIDDQNKTIENANKIIQEKKPDMTIKEAKGIIAEQDRLKKLISDYEQNIKDIDDEINPHDITIDKIRQKIDKIEKLLCQYEEEHKRSDLLTKHYQYIYKAYNDRNKIKGYIFKEHVPFINQRLKHYLEVFNLDIHIELTDTLSISSNMWGYEFESGGERKRTDVAFMLAMFDFHEQMYGRQSNLLVLDEVDGRMDDEGIDALINIIKTDLSNRVQSIIMISHRNLMFDTFPKELRVIRKDRYSHIEY